MAGAGWGDGGERVERGELRKVDGRQQVIDDLGRRDFWRGERSLGAGPLAKAASLNNKSLSEVFFTRPLSYLCAALLRMPSILGQHLL